MPLPEVDQNGHLIGPPPQEFNRYIGKFHQRLLASNRGKRYLCLESRAVVPARRLVIVSPVPGI